MNKTIITVLVIVSVLLIFGCTQQETKKETAKTEMKQATQNATIGEGDQKITTEDIPADDKDAQELDKMIKDLN